MSTVAAWEFSEIADEVRPVDRVGNVEDLATPSGLTTPSVVQGRYGRAREFGDMKALEAADQVLNATLLARHTTLFGWVDFKIENFANAQVGSLYLRRGGSNAIAFAVELERVSATDIKIRAHWEGPGPASTTGVTLTKPVGEFMVGVVRKWISVTSVEVKYYVNGDLVGEETVAEGNIAPAAGGTTAIGYDPIAVGDYLPDDTVLEFLQIEDDPVTQEELRQLYRRVAVHQPSGYKILRSFLPPAPRGAEKTSWAMDPDSFVQRWIAAEGDALGLEIADIERFREDFMPDRAYGGALVDWERITRQTPKPSDTVETRRARVLAFLRTVLGFSLDDIKAALESVYNLTSAQIDIIEFTGLRTDDFSVDDLTTPPSRMWITRAGAGTVVNDTGTPECDLAFGNVDARWYPLVNNPATDGGPMRETSLGNRLGGTRNGVYFSIEVNTFGVSTAAIFTGIFMRAASGEVLFWGFNDAGPDLVHFEFDEGSLTTPTSIVTPVNAPQILAMRYTGSGLYDLGREVAGAFVADVTGVAGPTDPAWCGFTTLERFEVLTTQTASFRNAKVFEPQSVRGFTYFAIRDTGLPGTFDLAAAQQLLNQQSPAHTIPIAATDTQGLALGPTGVGKLGSSPLFPKV